MALDWEDLAAVVELADAELRALRGAVVARDVDAMAAAGERLRAVSVTAWQFVRVLAVRDRGGW
jgi:hypothetical protein